MENACGCLCVGDTVPDFTIKTFEPTKGGFGEMGLREQLKHKRWTILFFYPADFTFV
jgi:peroxiredoxin (alkyl hydroperoxide reductase subunit C)